MYSTYCHAHVRLRLILNSPLKQHNEVMSIHYWLCCLFICMMYSLIVSTKEIFYTQDVKDILLLGKPLLSHDRVKTLVTYWLISFDESL
jgi:hypothetical protein